MDNTLYLVWNEKHKSDFYIIDEQHKAMLGVINTLYFNLSNGHGLNQAEKIINILEQLMQLYLQTLRSLKGNDDFLKYRELAVYQYENLISTKNAAIKAKEENDVYDILKSLKIWWDQFHKFNI